MEGKERPKKDHNMLIGGRFNNQGNSLKNFFLIKVYLF